jgi:hypothetical protein
MHGRIFRREISVYDLFVQMFPDHDQDLLSIRERTADTWEELSEAIVQSAAAGESQAAIRCSEEVLKRLFP